MSVLFTLVSTSGFLSIYSFQRSSEAARARCAYEARPDSEIWTTLLEHYARVPLSFKRAEEAQGQILGPNESLSLFSDMIFRDPEGRRVVIFPESIELPPALIGCETAPRMAPERWIPVARSPRGLQELILVLEEHPCAPPRAPRSKRKPKWKHPKLLDI